MKLIFTLILLPLLTIFIIDANAGSDYGTEGDFMLIGTGGRAMGLGNAYSSVVDDASAIHWNPAGLSRGTQKEIMLFHTTLFFSDINYEFIAYSNPTPRFGTFGIGYTRLSIGNIDLRDDHNNLLSTFKDIQSRYILSYSYQISPSLSSGISFHIDTHSMNDEKDFSHQSSGFGTDIGILCSLPDNIVYNFNLLEKISLQNLSCGVNIQNIVKPTIKLNEYPDALPINMKIGFSYHHPISKYLQDKLLFSCDINKSEFSTIKINYGTEYSVLKNMFSLRTGMDGKQVLGIGFGVKYKIGQVDYAFTTSELGENHRVSLNFRFGSTVDEMRAKLRQKEEEELNRRMTEKIKKDEEEQIAKWKSEGLNAYKNEEYESAIDIFNRILIWRPDDEEVKKYLTNANFLLHFSRGKNNYQRADYINALSEFNTALSFAPNDSATKNYIELSNKNLSNIISLREKIRYHYERGNQFYKEGKYAEATKEWDMVKQLSSANPDVKKDLDRLEERIAQYLEDGINDRDNGRYKSAIEKWELILKIDPNNQKAKSLIDETYKIIEANRLQAKTHLDRGISFYNENNYEPAIIEFEKALKLDPTLSSALDYLKKSQKAIEDAKKTTQTTITETTPTTDKSELEKHYSLGKKYYDSQDYINAGLEWEKVWQIDPYYGKVNEYLVKIYMFIGMNFYRDGKLNEAIESWTKVLKIDPANEKAKVYVEQAKRELEKVR